MRNTTRGMFGLCTALLGLTLARSTQALASDEVGATIVAWPNPALPAEVVTAMVHFGVASALPSQVQWMLDGVPYGPVADVISREATLTLPALEHGAHGLAVAYLSPDAEVATVLALSEPVLIDSPPVLPRFGFTVTSSRSCLVPLLGLLQGLEDPDGDPVRLAKINAISENGAAISRVGDSLLYHPVSGAAVSDSISYEAEDELGVRTTGVINVQIHAPTAAASAAPKIRISSGQVEVQFAQAPQKGFVVESTSDLHNWLGLKACSGTESTYRLEDQQTAGSASRFYRVRFQ